MEKRYIDLIHELEDSETTRNKALAERDASRAETANIKHLYDECLKHLTAAHAELAAMAEAHDALRETINRGLLDYEANDLGNDLDKARADAERLREQAVNWIPFTKATQDIFGSLLVWREDAGTFTAFYDEEQECWFSERGEDLTGDLPAFYAKMPKGPNE